MKFILAILGWTGKVLVVLAVTDWLLLRPIFLWPKLTTELEVSTQAGGSDTLIVYMPGIVAPARGSAGTLLDVWREYGDVMLVDYGDNRFDPRFVVDMTTQDILDQLDTKSYRKIVFLGSSMGGLLSYDVIFKLHELEATRDIPAIDLVVLDAPTQRRDFASPSDKMSLVSKLLYPGPLLNSLGLTRLLIVPPHEENIEPGVDRQKLAAWVNDVKSYKLSFYMDEVRYMLNHGVPEAGSLDGVVESVTYVRCTLNNETIKADTYATWLSVAWPTNFVRVDVDSTHVGFVERPTTWEKAFKQLLDRIANN